jgi:tRNA(Ile)-lysidine synthase
LRAESGSRSLEPLVERLIALDDLDGPIVAGCSGGADSLALLVLLRAAGHALHAVYVDHGLRAGVADERVVAAAAARFGASYERVAIDLAPGANLEARARDARHAALEGVRRRAGAAAVALGHTRDDQAETVLLNLLRGSGAAGLAGMPARRGSVRRPLLGLRRSETHEVCARLGLAPVHDAMNDDVRFRRAWIRREVLPRLERDARRDLVDVLARQADVMRVDDEYLDSLAAELVAEGAPLAADLVSAPLALARRAVRQWLGPPPAALEAVQAVLDVASGTARAVDLAGGRRVERAADGRLHLVDREPEAPPPIRLRVPGGAVFGPLDIHAWIEHAPPVAWPDGRTVAVFDADAVGPEVEVRGPEPGQRFRPVGRGGSKLVLDALRDAGVAASARATRPIVRDAHREVCWVVGYRIDDRVKVTARTRRYLWMAVAPASPTIRDERST